MKKENRIDKFQLSGSQSDIRRNFLKASVSGSLAGLFIWANPKRLFAYKPKEDNKLNEIAKTKVKIHPFAIKRNKKG